jgi:lipopolysaccharide export system protein LptC
MQLRGERQSNYRVKNPSRLGVVALKYGIPGALIFLVFLLFYWPSITSYLIQAPPEGTREIPKEPPIDEEALKRAKNLHFEGIDQHNQPYTLVAQEGVEFENSPSELQKPHLTLKLNSGETVTLTSDMAKFDRPQQKVELIGHVIVIHSSGHQFETSRAWIDLENSSAFGHDPVNGKGPNGQVYSHAGFQLTEKGDKIKLMGRPELYIMRDIAR